MKCEGCPAIIASPRKGQKFCSSKCRVDYWMALHPRKKPKPKRIRSRERDRLYTIIHKGETLAQLRVQAMEAARVQALRETEQ